MKAKTLAGLFTAMALSVSTFAFANPILVSQQPWGYDHDIDNMTHVFGSGNFTHYNSFAAATPEEIFAPTNSFVMVEGGDGSQSGWSSYVSGNSSTILNWVNAGGSLLLMSGGWMPGVYPLGPGSLVMDYTMCSRYGTLTAAGQGAFTFAPLSVSQEGAYLAQDYVTGAGLTSFMTGAGGNAIVAGTAYGNGYIMYSGLTDSEFHYYGDGLVDSVIDFTQRQGEATAAGAEGGESAVVPEPATLLLVGAGAGLAGFHLVRRRNKG